MPGRTTLLYSLFLSAWFLSSCTYRFYQSGCQYPIPGSLVKQATLDSAVHETSGLLYSLREFAMMPVGICLYQLKEAFKNLPFLK